MELSKKCVQAQLLAQRMVRRDKMIMDESSLYLKILTLKRQLIESEEKLLEMRNQWIIETEED